MRLPEWPRTQPSGTHTGLLPSRLWPGCALKAWLCQPLPLTTASQMPEVRPTSQLRGDQELLPVVVYTSMIAPRHTHGAENNTVPGLPAPHTWAKFKVFCQDSPRLEFHITYWSGMAIGCVPEKQGKVKTLSDQGETKPQEGDNG